MVLFKVLKLALFAVVGIVVVLAALAAIAYATDYALEATVTDTNCPIGGLRTVTVETKVGGIEYTLEDVPHQQCLAVNEGNYVEYRVRSQRVSLYQSEGGSCIYDSEGGIGGCGA